MNQSEKIVHLELKSRVVDRFLLVLEAVTDADDHDWNGFLDTVEYEDIEFWKRMLTEALEKSK